MNQYSLKTQIQKIKELEINVPDAEIFLNNLHRVIASREDRRKGFFNGLGAGLLVLLISLFSISQLTFDSGDIFVIDYFPEIIVDENLDLLVYDMAYYLVAESEDMFTTIDLLHELNFEPVNSLLEDVQ